MEIRGGARRAERAYRACQDGCDFVQPLRGGHELSHVNLHTADQPVMRPVPALNLLETWEPQTVCHKPSSAWKIKLPEPSLPRSRRWKRDAASLLARPEATQRRFRPRRKRRCIASGQTVRGSQVARRFTAWLPRTIHSPPLRARLAWREHAAEKAEKSCWPRVARRISLLSLRAVLRSHVFLGVHFRGLLADSPRFPGV